MVWFKVADCILLMSLDKQSVVPVDTHIHSMAVTHYGYENKSQLTAAKYDGISMFFENLWQPMAGWAQAVSSGTIERKKSIVRFDCFRTSLL